MERFGELVGLVSVKDCLRYTIEHEEGHDNPSARSDELEATIDELKLWWKDSQRWIAARITGHSPPPSPSASIRLESAATFNTDSDNGDARLGSVAR